MNNFIHEQFIEDISLCDALIEYHKNGNKHPGSTSLGVNPMIKNSTDCTLLDNDLIQKYDEQLHKVMLSYIKNYPWCNGYSPFKRLEACNIQHYKPKEGFAWWHCERSRPIAPFTTRHLVFMTYLNDVNDGGGTEFFHQQKTIKAEKGKTIVWPVDWTYTHRGEISQTQEKYIITGWFNYYEQIDVFKENNFETSIDFIGVK